MEVGTGQRLIAHYTTDVEEYVDRVGAFLRRRPVEHGVLLSIATTRVGDEVAGEASNLWLWVENDEKVVAAAQLTPPFGAYVSTGPAEAMRELGLRRPRGSSAPGNVDAAIGRHPRARAFTS